MAEVSAAVIKRTQETLGKQIKKPGLTEKLLRKPPFRFLHDIITSVIRTSGYFDGLYTDEELQSENVKDRDGKIAFLQKAVDVVKLSANENIKMRPAKTVAGLEPELTNEFLQAIGKAIERKIDSKEAVEAVKNGVTPEPKKPSKHAGKSKTEKSKQTAQAGPSTKKPSSDSNKKAESKTRAGAKAEAKGSTENKKSRPKVPKQGTFSKEEGQSKTKKPEEPPTPAEKIVVEPAKDSKDDKNEEISIIQSDVNETPEAEVVAAVEKEEVIEPVVEAEPIKPTDNKETIDYSATEGSEEKPMLMKAESVEKSTSSIKTKTEVNSSDADTVKEHRSKSKEAPKVREKRSPPLKPKHKPEEPLSNATEDATKFPMDEAKIPMPKPVTALRSAAIRPVSARPSAPRRRDRNVKQILNHDSYMHDPAEAKKPEKKDLMNEFDDGENIIIADIIQDVTAATNNTDAIDTIADGKQGHLVQQILETQTVFMSADSDAKNGETVISIDESSINDRKSQARNMTELRQSIQKLSLYITPLGKLMEYFQEDVDAMQIELLMWQNAYATATAEIKQEQSQTESLLEQFQYQLAEINNSIKEHTEQINNTTTSIIQNEEKISKLIGTL